MCVRDLDKLNLIWLEDLNKLLLQPQAATKIFLTVKVVKSLKLKNCKAWFMSNVKCKLFKIKLKRLALCWWLAKGFKDLKKIRLFKILHKFLHIWNGMVRGFPKMYNLEFFRHLFANIVTLWQDLAKKIASLQFFADSKSRA